MKADDPEKEEKRKRSRRRRRSRSRAREVGGVNNDVEDDKKDKTVEEIPKPGRKLRKHIYSQLK